MKKANSSQSQPLLLPYLPEEITGDILTRLPVKTLVRFRCVCKSWLNLISTRSFIDTHLVKSSKSFIFAKQKIFLWHRDAQRRSYYLKSCSLETLFSPTFDYGNLINCHSDLLDYGSNKIVGSCNGLVCILVEKAFILWNPSTRESKKLSAFDNYLGLFGYSFGYDKLNDDYKIVQIECGLSASRNVVKLYSLRTNSWKKIGDFPNCGGFSDGKFANGALHWLLWDSDSDSGSGSDSDSSFVILFIDLGNESYGEIPQPNCGGGICCSSLIVVEGCISLCYNFTDTRADIWVMKEHGVRESWVKLYTISNAQVRWRNGYFTYLLSNSLTGEILLEYGAKLWIYHSKHGTFETKRIKDTFCPHQGAITYVESLVSP